MPGNTKTRCDTPNLPRFPLSLHSVKPTQPKQACEERRIQHHFELLNVCVTRALKRSGRVHNYRNHVLNTILKAAWLVSGGKAIPVQWSIHDKNSTLHPNTQNSSDPIKVVDAVSICGAVVIVLYRCCYCSVLMNLIQIVLYNTVYRMAFS